MEIVKVPFRVRLAQYLSLCRSHFRKYWRYYVLPVLAIWIIQIWMRLDFNYTDSLPEHVYLTIKGNKTNFRRGDRVAFEFPTEHPYSPYRKGAHFLKLVAGTEGDLVKVDAESNVWIIYKEEIFDFDPDHPLFGNGHYMGKAKHFSRKGKPLVATEGGIIPPGYIYVTAPHPDSLDSRYAMLGLLSLEYVTGKSYPLF